VFRKLASHAKPSMEIETEDGKVKINVKAAFFTQTMIFPINEPYEQEFDGIKMNVGSLHMGCCRMVARITDLPV